MTKFLLGILLPAIVTVAAAASHRQLPLFSAEDLTPYWLEEGKGARRPMLVSAFSLQDQERRTVRDDDLRGRVSIVNFFFTQCPQVCPLMMNRLNTFKKAHSSLHLQILSLSMQSEHDSPELLAGFARDHHLQLDQWHLLTGSKEVIANLGTRVFKANRLSGSAKEELVHSSNIYLIDGAKQIRGIYDSADPRQMQLLAGDLQTLEVQGH